MGAADRRGDVEVTAATRRNRLDIEIEYRVRATNTFYNLVYPFYLRRAGHDHRAGARPAERRGDAELLAAARATPAWRPAPGDAGDAVAQVFGRYLEALVARLNQAPDKNRLAFLDQLGVEPAAHARGAGAGGLLAVAQLGHARVPARSQAPHVAGRDEPLVFETRTRPSRLRGWSRWCRCGRAATPMATTPRGARRGAVPLFAR